MASLFNILAKLWFVCGASSAAYNNGQYTSAKRNGEMFTESILFESPARSLLQCTATCNQHETCESFTFYNNKCRGHGVMVTSLESSTPMAGARSFVRKSAVKAKPAPCWGFHQFQCGDGTCISITARCNGTSECSGSEDEQGCGGCTFPYLPCPDGSNCILESCVCDSVEECADGSDESNCSADYATHSPQCDDGYILYVSDKCDGVSDCTNGQDEQNCDGCSFGDFSCGDGNCIKEYRVCDTVTDCADGRDEANCG